MVSLLLNFLFCSCILSLISFSCLCSLVAHWDSLRWLFWIFVKQFRDLHSFKVLTGAFLGCSSFTGMFSWFFMILVVWHWCLWIWRKIHLFQTLHKSSLSPPMGLFVGWGNLSLCYSVSVWNEGCLGSMKLFFLFFSICFFLISVLHLGAITFQMDSRALMKSFSSIEFFKFFFFFHLWKDKCWNAYSSILLIFSCNFFLKD